MLANTLNEGLLLRCGLLLCDDDVIRIQEKHGVIVLYPLIEPTTRTLTENIGFAHATGGNTLAEPAFVPSR